MAGRLSLHDPHSYSNPQEVIVTNIYLNLTVEFPKQILTGYVDLTVDRKDISADLILDISNLAIISIKDHQNNNLQYTVHNPVANFGSKLVIKFAQESPKTFDIRIVYETHPTSPSLMWLTPEQTHGKKHPFVFAQNQAIYARCMFPCQDTPCIKTPFSASITAPAELTVLMSGIGNGMEENSDPSLKTYKFIQKIPVPSYLIVIAVGALESRPIGDRCHVWAEKEIVDEAAEEFSDTGNFLKIAETLMGEYVWGIYDVLVMPPSFAYGGMENPCLTFVTPTLLAGDKSQSHVVAHEIAHSWTGNLVTNKNWEHFWLNEGFTMFLERKINGCLEGKSVRHFNALGGWKELVYVVNDLGPTSELTKLCPDLTGVNPDDCYNRVPYEKGHAFLFYLESILGGPEIFEEYLKAYVQEFKFRSLDTEEWKSHFCQYFSEKKDILDKIDWDTWLYGPGFPPITPEFDLSMARMCQTLKDAWIRSDENDLSNFSAKDIENMNSNQVIEFLSLILLEEPIGVKKLQKMTELYKLKETKNAEIRFRFIRLGLLNQWKGVISHAVKFISEQGRHMYISPIYKDLYNWDETRELAIATFKENASMYMVFAANAVRVKLNLPVEY